MRLRGSVECIARLPDGYALVGLRETGRGGFAPRFRVLVPTLVLVRDGFPNVDEEVELEARRLTGDLARSVPNGVGWCAHGIVRHHDALGTWQRSRQGERVSAGDRPFLRRGKAA